MRQMDEALTRIQHCWFSNGESMIVLRDCGRPVLGVGKDPPDTNALLGELAIQARDFGDVAVRDGAIAGGEDKDHDANSRPGEFLDRRALKIQSVGLTGMDCRAR